MSTVITNISKAKVISNLDTYTHTTLQASMYTISLSTSIRPLSGLSIIINKNGTPFATSIVPSATQGIQQLAVTINCAISDVLSVVVSSAATADLRINSIKGILDIRPGTV